MIVRRLLSDADGDIPLSSEISGAPFKINSAETHPFFTFGDYFAAIQDFLLKDHAGPLKRVLHARRRISIKTEDIDRMVIRSEKHGALYHIASVEISRGDVQMKFAVSTALTDQSRKALHHEFKAIRFLNYTFDIRHLPEDLFLDDICFRDRTGREITLTMAVTEWFDDYHEWHFEEYKGGTGQKIRLWDLNRGYRFLSDEAKYDLFRDASLILTYYYDIKKFHQIYPWHHAAGDFVIKLKGEKMTVRLTTARRYDPIMAFPVDAAGNVLTALTYFFLNLTIRMRLDKAEGAGGVLWAGADILPAVIEGFFKGLKEKAAEIPDHSVDRPAFLDLLRSFAPEELEKAFIPLMNLYAEEDPADFSAIRENLFDHSAQLYQALQGVHG